MLVAVLLGAGIVIVLVLIIRLGMLVRILVPGPAKRVSYYWFWTSSHVKGYGT